MQTFALVHGAWHGAWCWQPLESELLTLGHEVVTVDLPCDDPNATFVTYADVVASALHNVPDVVLVGHSLAGLTIPLVASRRPVRHLIFLCALIPEPSRSLVEQMEAEPDMLNPDDIRGAGTEIDELGRSRWIDPIAARDCMYGDCTDEQAQWAFDHLRPQATAPYLQAHPFDALPEVSRTYILCTEDRLVTPDWSRRAALERLGVEALELPGSHSPFVSRPAQLARLLIQSAEDTASESRA